MVVNVEILSQRKVKHQQINKKASAIEIDKALKHSGRWQFWVFKPQKSKTPKHKQRPLGWVILHILESENFEFLSHRKVKKKYTRRQVLFTKRKG